jgi:hypothetical protein
MSGAPNPSKENIPSIPITAGGPILPDSLLPIDWNAVEDAFRDWYARNLHALELGGTGDLVTLLLALNAASVKRRNSSP